MKIIGTKASTEHITKAGCSPTVLTLLNKISRKLTCHLTLRRWPEVYCHSSQYTLCFCAKAALNFEETNVVFLRKILITKCEIVTCSAHVTNTPARKEKSGHKKRKKI